MKKRSLGLLTAVLLAGSLLASTGVAAGDGPVYAPVGKLDLIANATAGDKFTFTPTGATAATLTESFTANNQGKISESGANLTTLTPTGPGSGGQLYVGLKDHLFGVKAQGEGNGTPASQVNDSGPNGQTLRIALTSQVPGDYAWFARLGFKFKFGATVRIQAYKGTTLIAQVTKSCDGSDCGADSGSDRKYVDIGNGTASTLFDSVVISIDSPSDGAVSLLDEPGYDTYFDIVKEYDGELACGDTTDAETGQGVTGQFRRLGTTGDTGCGVNKFYNFSVEDIANETTVKFEPATAVFAEYRGDLYFPIPSGDQYKDLYYDPDGEGPQPFELMLWCDVSSSSDARGDFTDVLDGAYPALPAGRSSCIVAFDRAAGQNGHWVVYLQGDPFYK